MTMSKTIKIPLDTKEIAKMINKLDMWAKQINKATQGSIDELAELGKSVAESNYGSNGYQATSDMDFAVVDEGEYRKKVYMGGLQAIYEEFGTGTIGERSPHENKVGKGLNAYNSGQTIRAASEYIEAKTGIPQGELYWTYMDESGKRIYTQGIPAGKEIYEGRKAVESELSKVVQKHIDEVFKWFH